jgi:hypothetical protein
VLKLGGGARQAVVIKQRNSGGPRRPQFGVAVGDMSDVFRVLLAHTHEPPRLGRKFVGRRQGSEALAGPHDRFSEKHRAFKIRWNISIDNLERVGGLGVTVEVWKERVRWDGGKTFPPPPPFPVVEMT